MLSKLERLSPKKLFETQAGVVQLGEDEAAVVVHVTNRVHALGCVAVVQSCVVINPCSRESDATCRRCGTSRRDTGSEKNFPVLPQVSVVMRVPLCGQRLCRTFTVLSVWRTIRIGGVADRSAE